MTKTLWLICILSQISSAAYGHTAIHVSPSGNDLNNGCHASPVLTIHRALDMASESDSVTIILAEGVYNLPHPIVIDNKILPDNASLSLRGAGTGKTIISGGIELPPFKVENDSLWSIDLGGTPFTLADIQQLYVNGHRATLARTPNHDKLYNRYCATQYLIDSVPVRKATRNGLAIHKIALPPKAFDALCRLSGPIERTRISFLHAWDMTRRHIETFNPEDSTIFVMGNPQKTWNPIDREAQFFIENDMSFLDEPGEWYYNRDTYKMYYIPLPEESAPNSVATVPLTDQLMTIEGTPDKKISGINISDITFAYTRYDIGRRGDDPVQAAARMGATVRIRNASDISIDNCEITHTGNTAIWLEDGCRNCSITHCYLHDLGIGGIKLGNIVKPADEIRDLTKSITIDNNIIHSGGKIFPTGAGILLTHASDNTISHNDIADFYYSGISAGWTWGYAHSPSKRNNIIFNHIHHIGRGILSDMGGIYTLGRSEGTIVSNNVIHHIYSYSYGGWGLYTDEGSSGITMRDNLVYNCKSSGFHQHYGRDNRITNNIFVNQLYSQLEATLEEEHHSFSFNHNIIYFTEGKMYGIKWDSVNSTTDYNAYWHTEEKNKTAFNGLRIGEWQSKTGRDMHSIVADPQFRNIGTGDFEIQNNSLLRKIGFKPFDYRSAGVYGSSEWMSKAELPSLITTEFDMIVDAYEAVPDDEKPKKFEFKE